MLIILFSFMPSIDYFVSIMQKILPNIFGRSFTTQHNKISYSCAYIFWLQHFVSCAVFRIVLSVNELI